MSNGHFGVGRRTETRGQHQWVWRPASADMGLDERHAREFDSDVHLAGPW
jgi:hypothetical protein